ncbi:hypothetical protein NQ318_021556 [Aromia moschata]|uniref:Lipase domain-containing protein n=1 Tax=Aromia moschata TaxID=1265417 RepID=A0AAV8YHX5_9CUCU|nr:hypothetical protein NQ318_021556 [Aromia moschata]
MDVRYYVDTRNTTIFGATTNNDSYFIGKCDTVICRYKRCSEETKKATVEPRALETDVTYHFYTKVNSHGLNLHHNRIELLKATDFCTKRYTLFIVHGWLGDKKSTFNHHIKETLLTKHNINFFVVDWSPVASRNYVASQRAVVKVGHYMAMFIKALVTSYGLNLSRVAFVGHSLGAHVAGNAGAALDGQVDYIVGLDPASPLFSRRKTDNRLDRTDAKYVQVMHTNGGYLGIQNPIGHSDYYPNGGSSQPGCGYDIMGTCAHSRAWSYYAESLATENNLFLGWRCPSYQTFKKGLCRDNAVSLMAGYAIDKNASGTYFLDTNESPPFGKG